ncbi:hypothetical protein [Candidatus Cryosericum terrychapinii]|uniref:Uncharacterized protein n=1 Tax=Candidatus Cryosericum terrychapinii TaxID=2290919 RepID=A0A398CYX0_9BACT|nr:hypothetical protein [Candidatus Cryosericum terrychapinii]RIE05718.1 hypothetical protein SMC7_06070 [Candidatus Cryosericum terrychapinii]
MFGIGPFTMLDCADCQRGQSLSLSPEEADRSRKDMRTFLASNWRCPVCGKEWSVQEAMIQGLISSHQGASMNVVGNILLHGKTTVATGIERVVELAQEVPLILGVNFTPWGKYARLGWVSAGKDKFIITSSTITATAGQDPKRYAGLGEELDVDWMLSGRSNWSNLDVPVWQIVLIQAREQLDRKGYSLSILSSVVALEAFVGAIITGAFHDAGVEKKVSDIVLEHTSGITRKIDSLLPSIAGISLKKSGLRGRLGDVIERRNEIVHGDVAESTEGDAREAFEVCVRTIFHLLVQSLNADATRSAREQRLRSKSASGDLGMESRA